MIHILDRFSKDDQRIDDNMFHNLGENYLDIIDIQRKGKKFFIDKLPQNYLYYKFIKSLLFLVQNLFISIEILGIMQPQFLSRTLLKRFNIPLVFLVSAYSMRTMNI